MVKKVEVKKKSNPNRKPFQPAIEKTKQTRKKSGGSGTSLMHHAARKESGKEAADSNVSPTFPKPDTKYHNRADAELQRLQKNNSGGEQ